MNYFILLESLINNWNYEDTWTKRRIEIDFTLNGSIWTLRVFHEDIELFKSQIQLRQDFMEEAVDIVKEKLAEMAIESFLNRGLSSLFHDRKDEKEARMFPFNELKKNIDEINKKS